MSDKNSSLINLPDLPDSIDTAVKNLTDKPTQGVGQTLADVWYLVFGGITQVADKRRMKYAHDLELYKQELSQAISSIPGKDLIEPNIQTTAQALENSKYCIESEELRKLFVNLISRAMDANYRQAVHPSFAEIIKQMSPVDARIFKSLPTRGSFPLVDYIIEDPDTHRYNIQFSTAYLSSIPDISMSVSSSCISSLNHLGLIYIDSQATLDSQEAYKPYEETRLYKLISSEAETSSSHRKASLTKYSGRLTSLGLNFLEVCVE